MKTIYNTYIEVTSQEQADRLKQMCIDNNLHIWDDEFAFYYTEYKNSFRYNSQSEEFWITSISVEGKVKVTEEPFLKLLKDERVRQNNN